MSTAVLKSISAENFASFANKVTFTCVADGSKKESAMNTFEAGEDVINKVSYVYGSNGSGKTFFCKILRNRYCSYDRWDDNTYHPADQCYFASFFIHIFSSFGGTFHI